MLFRWVTLVAVMLGAPLGLAAHPHVWAEVRAEVAVTGGYVEGVWTVWTFDDIFSQLMLSDHDADADGKIDPPEVVSLKKGYFDNLKVYQYFTHLGVGSKALKVPEPRNFTAHITPEGKVAFRFFLPLGLRLDAKTTLAFSFYDDSFFTDMVFEKKNPVALTVSDGGRASVVLKPDKSKTYYAGQVTPTFAFLSWGPS